MSVISRSRVEVVVVMNVESTFRSIETHIAPIFPFSNRKQSHHKLIWCHPPFCNMKIICWINWSSFRDIALCDYLPNLIPASRFLARINAHSLSILWQRIDYPRFKNISSKLMWRPSLPKEKVRPTIPFKPYILSWPWNVITNGNLMNTWFIIRR